MLLVSFSKITRSISYSVSAIIAKKPDIDANFRLHTCMVCRQSTQWERVAKAERIGRSGRFTVATADLSAPTPPFPTLVCLHLFHSPEAEHHIDAQPRTRSLLSLLYQLLDFGAAVLASLLPRHGLLLCHIAQITSGIPHLLHRLLCRVFHLTGCL